MMADEKQRPPPHAEKGEQQARKNDPHGTKTGGGGAHDPKGSPTPDRQQTEATAEPASGE
jgi:hypothetical protein